MSSRYACSFSARARCYTFFSLTVVLVCAGAALSPPATPEDRIATFQADRPEANEPEVVEASMHEFMEYVFEPSYKRLKKQMATKPTQKSDWKTIKAESLTMAEASNLLWLREPQENQSSWKKHAKAVRTAGASLYQAARKKNASEAKTAYGILLQKCNACHRQFADGEHQLKP